MSEKKYFLDVMEEIADQTPDAETMADVWNAAIELCAQIADDCIEHQIAHEYREYCKVK